MPAVRTILHYVGADDDRGGIVSVVRALSDEGRFGCILGVNAGCVQRRTPALPALEFPALEAETISVRNLWRARRVAREARCWLRADSQRIFHGHSRAGMLVGFWLHRWGEPRVVVSVHCYGRQRWFYRFVSSQMGGRLYWLTPAMRRYYGAEGDGWSQCIPGGAPISDRAVYARVADGTVRIAGIGAITRWKGWHLLVEALGSMPAPARSRLRFRHIGGADASVDSRRYAQELAALTASAGLSARIEWLGQQSSSAPLLAESDCLLVASRNEPFSVAMLEALQAGVPVVAADSGGAVDVIEPGVNGWLFRSGDAADLARVLRSLVETDALARIRIDKESLRRFTAPVVAAQWAAVYALLSSPTSAAPA